MAGGGSRYESVTGPPCSRAHTQTAPLPGSLNLPMVFLITHWASTRPTRFKDQRLKALVSTGGAPQTLAAGPDSHRRSKGDGLASSKRPTARARRNKPTWRKAATSASSQPIMTCSMSSPPNFRQTLGRKMGIGSGTGDLFAKLIGPKRTQ